MKRVPSSVLPRAPEVQPDALVGQGKARDLGRRIREVGDPPASGEHDIQQPDEYVLVLLHSEDGLEPGLGQDVHIPLCGHPRFILSLHISILFVPVPGYAPAQSPDRPPGRGFPR